MRTRFIVLTNNAPRVWRDAMTKTLAGAQGKEGIGFWHWYADSWAIVDPLGRTAEVWRERIRRVFKGPFIIVEVPAGGDWTGYADPKHFEWWEGW